MQINKPVDLAKIKVELCVRWVGGSHSIHVPFMAVAAYNADPDGYVAKLLGVSVSAYREWIEADGGPYCGAMTKKGDPCKVLTGPVQQSLTDWLDNHRAHYCKAHGG